MAETDLLLLTKLYPPAQRPRLVDRPRLLELVDKGLTHPFTLVSAPAGFGKTTLLGEWLHSLTGRDYSFAWLTLDHDDNDPSRFLLYLAAALGTLQPGLGQTALSAIHIQPAPALTGILTMLINDIEGLPAPSVLVLDDYHIISAQPVHALVQFLIEHLPARMHLVMLTRSDPPLPLARLRARDQLAEIRVPRLRFQPDEAARFLNDLMGLELSNQDIAALESRTEGWIAGLQLAAVSLQQQLDRHAFVTAFAGDDRYVMDYLLEEVLQQQSPDLQAFLLRTSFLERLSGPLCQAVTGDSASQAILADLDQANLFVTALDNRRYWYRYHPLFADLLRHRMLQNLSPSECHQLVEHACGWYESAGLVVEAISQAITAGEYDLAADLLERHVVSIFFRSETMLVHHWLESLPGNILRQRPLLCVVYANTIAHTGLFQAEALEQTGEWLSLAESSLAARGPGQADETLTRSFIAMSRAYLALWRNELPEAIIDLANRALAGLPAQDALAIDQNFQRLRSGLVNNLGISYMAIGDERSALLSFAEAQRVGEACGDLLNYSSAAACQCLLLSIHVHLPEAYAICTKVIGSAHDFAGQPERPVPYTAVVYSSLGKILLEWNELPEAETTLLKSLELMRLVAASQEGRMEILVSLARLYQARGDIAGALAWLDQVESDSAQAKIMVTSRRIRLYLAESSKRPESLEKALAWAEGRALQPVGPYWPAEETLTLVRVMLAEFRQAISSGKPKKSDGLSPLIKFLDDQIRETIANHWVERVTELYLLKALAWQVQNCLPEAQETLLKSLEAGQPGGYIRLYLDEGLPLRRLLGHLKIADHRLSAYANRILQAGELFQNALPSPGVPNQLIEPLSDRELEILLLLEQGISNAAISQKLFISLNTTKKHITHIFEKLAVSDRDAAGRRARELGLVTNPDP